MRVACGLLFALAAGPGLAAQQLPGQWEYGRLFVLRGGIPMVWWTAAGSHQVDSGSAIVLGRPSARPRGPLDILDSAEARRAARALFLVLDSLGAEGWEWFHTASLNSGDEHFWFKRRKR